MVKCRAWLIPFLVVALSLARETEEKWVEVRSQHFLVISNGSQKQTSHVADQFERMRSVFHAAFPKMEVDPGSPIVVIALKNEKDFRTLEPEPYLGKGKMELAGLFLRAPDKNYILMRLDANGEHPYATIYHEYTHLLTSKTAELLPLWLTEGLAEFYENTDIQGKDVILGQASAGNILFLREHRLIPLSLLFSIDQTSPYYQEENKGSIFYAQSWALTHYLMMKDKRENSNKVGDYLILLGKKIDPTAAAERTFGDLKQLQTALERYIGQFSFNALKMSSPPVIDDAAFKIKEISNLQADAIRADFLAYNGRIKESDVLLANVLRQDPENVQAMEAMGYSQFRDGRLDEALRWYEKAIRHDSQNFLAHYYFAAISISMSNGTGADDLIEASLRSAIKLNPSFAPAYDRLAAFYVMRDENLQDAHILSLQAVQLDPGNLGYRLNGVHVLLAMNMPDQALMVIQEARKVAKSAADIEMLESLKARVQDSRVVWQQAEEEQRRSKDDMSQQSAKRSASDANAPLVDSLKTPPSESTNYAGPHHFASGTIKNVRCAPPAVLDLDLHTGERSVSLHTGNYYKVDFTALDFAPKQDLKPCSDLEGVRARIEFVESSSSAQKPGGIVSIEMTK